MPYGQKKSLSLKNWPSYENNFLEIRQALSIKCNIEALN